MKAAVIRTGGKQYRVSEGDTLRVELLEGKPGDAVQFSDVLMIGGDAPKLGKPTISGAKVEGQILEQDRGERLVVFKFKRRKRYKRKGGHRQYLTSVKITKIEG
jgi:large subunit ribosomal protein L21